MEKFPTNPIESEEKEPEKISRERLIAFAKEKPPQDPEVREMLMQWLEQTRIPESSSAESVEFIDVAIMHSAMKYRLGFITKEEVLQELEEAGGMLRIAQQTFPTHVLYRRRHFRIIYPLQLTK
jgi:hypothetical protein